MSKETETAPYRITGHVAVPNPNGGGEQSALVVGHVYNLPVGQGDALVEQGLAESMAQRADELTPEQEARKAEEVAASKAALAEEEAEKTRAAEQAEAAQAEADLQDASDDEDDDEDVD